MVFKFSLKGTLIVIFAAMSGSIQADPRPLAPHVETEELVYTYEPANNGAGPLWCYGSTCLVCVGGDVFASGIETLKGVKPLNNVRWMLFKRGPKGWERQQADPKGRTREPCPLACFQDGRVFMSVNPTLVPGAYNGRAEPQVLEFSAKNPRAPYKTLRPVWPDHPPFTEHSYRGFCADSANKELLLFNILQHDLYYWSFMDRTGKWSKCGKLYFPIGTEYEHPEPIRLCYPEIVLRNREVHVLAISDIIEPVKEWREYKLILHNGKRWDYDFRRLFYTWTPDITSKPFSKWIEVASREKTCGHITNLDLWLDAKGRAHLLWEEKSVWDPRMRDKFFPDVKMTTSLMYGVIEKGKVVLRKTLAAGGEGLSGVIPGYARFHVTPDGRLFVFYYHAGKDANGKRISENRIMEILPDGEIGKDVPVELQHPFTSFMTATVRGGSPPSDVLDVLGVASGRAGISYARISLFGDK